MSGRVTPRKTPPAGFEVGGDEAVIDFPPGHRYHGLVARLTLDLSIDDVYSLNAARDRQDDPDAISAALGPLLVSWNAEFRGEQLPPTEKGLRALPLRCLLALFSGYAQALKTVVSIDDPLDESSSSGDG